jgi:hypothetical protein
MPAVCFCVSLLKLIKSPDVKLLKLIKSQCGIGVRLLKLIISQAGVGVKEF